MQLAAAMPPLPEGGPNEPRGFRRVSYRTFEARVEDHWTDRGDPNFRIVEDRSVAGRGPTLGRAVYPVGFPSGSGPIMTNFAVTGQPRSLYLSFWARLSPNWEGHRSGVNKIFHIWIGGRNRVYLSAQGQGPGPYEPQVRLQGIPTPEHAQNLRPNVGRDVSVRRGAWVHWEILLIANTTSARDGSAEWWIDGRPAGRHTGLIFTSFPRSVGWETVSWNPTWGGGGPPVSAEMYMDLDDVYVSVAP